MFAALIILVFLLIVFYYKQKDLENLPPGPPWYRFLANLKALSPAHIQKEVPKLREKYGDIMCVTKIMKTTIMISGREALRDIFIKKANWTSERPDSFIKIMGDGHGIVGNSGKVWKEQRSFALSTLRTFGFGKQYLETPIHEEVCVFLSGIEKENGIPFDIRILLTASVSNIICSLALGRRFDHDDEKFQQILSNIHRPIGNKRSFIFNIMPFLKHFPGDFFGLKSMKKYFSRIRSRHAVIIEEHRQSLDETNIRDFIDAFLVEQSKHSNDTDSTFTDAQLHMVIQNFFIAGTETTVTTIRWLVLYLIHFPEVQRKMHEEIDRVIGPSRLPSLEDKARLPYCQAVINETNRLSSIIPYSIPHGVSEEFYYRGHRIPKGATLYPNLVSVAMDPEVFPNPEKFDPSRFIDRDGNFFGQESIYPFSLGRRACLGESLARMELFLFATALVQRFDLLPANPDKLPPLEGLRVVTYSPHPYEIKAVKRT